MDAGQIPPVHITIKLVEQKFKEGNGGAVFDGYPRNMDQAEAMESFAKPDLVINLMIPDEILIEKILARSTCPKCNAIYNTSDIEKTIDGVRYHMPALRPKKYGICNKCSSGLMKRSDETPEIIATKLKIQRDSLKPLVEYYEKQGILKNVNVTCGKSEMLEKIFSLIESEMRK
jgi:adenylate kinase